MLKALIFDCDGVIVNSEPAHLASFQRVLAENGISLSRQDYLDRYLAMDDKGCFLNVFEANGRSLDAEGLAGCLQTKARYFEDMMKTDVVVFPGVAEFVRAAAKRFPLAVASGARKMEVTHALRSAGIEDCFKAVVSSEDVRKGKPDPESFVTAMKRLGESVGGPIHPFETVVFEDSKHGLAAAKTAGMRCVGITTSYRAEDLAAADLVIGMWSEITLPRVEALCR